MIIGILGKIIKKEPTFVHVRTNAGLIYKINVSLFCSAKIDLGEIELHITNIIREDASNMYGFIDLDEKKVFDTLVKLNGIGPSTALAICSTLNPLEFSNALISNSVEVFKKVPGIGPKSAKRILVELSDFVLESSELSPQSSSILESSLALESLGFKKEKVRSILSTCKATDTTSLIKEALKKLG